MANVKQMVNDVLGTINGALAILDKIPKLDESDGNFEFGMTVSPFALILEVLKNTKGYDCILEWVGGFLNFALPELEVALKTLLMLNLKGLITCSLNPIIPNDLLINGIVFDLKEIDLFNMLSYCPLDKGKGDNYYFGVKAAKVPDDLRRSQDFNAFLWYMVNRSNCREIWNKCKPAETSWAKYISDTTFGSLNESALGGGKYELPLKDFSCVDIDLATVDENGNNQYLKDNNSTEWVNAKWNDVFDLVNETGQKVLQSLTENFIGDINYKKIKEHINTTNNEDDKKAFIYITQGMVIKPIVYIAKEGDEDDEWYYENYTFAEDLFDISDNLYDFKTKKCRHITDKNKKKDESLNYPERICIYKNEKNFLKVNSDTIEKRKYEFYQGDVLQNGSVRCGRFDRHLWEEEYDLTELDNCRVTGINDAEYYHCNHLGYVTHKEKEDNEDGKITISSGKAVKFPKKYSTYNIKKNLLTGENQNIKIGIKCNEKKLKKNAGIITLEYNESSSSTTNAEGGGVSGMTLPYRNCLHVFIGNVQPQNYGDIIKLRNEIRKCEEDKRIAQEEIEWQYGVIEKAEKLYNDTIKGKKKEIKKNGIKGDDADTQLENTEKDAKNKFTQTQSQCLNIIKQESDKITEKDKEISAYESAIYASEKVYRSHKQNYYYKHTLIEFNFDYIWSLKLFDPKVVAAQLIDALVGLTTFNLGLSYEQIFLQEEIKRMVSDIIESDDTEVNDCFFTFSNDKYNSLVIQSEKRRQGLYSTHPNQEGIKINMSAIEDALNMINSASTKEEQQTAIKGALREIQGIISTPDYAQSDKISGNFEGLDFIEKLFTNLATVIAQSFLSPKVYLLLAVNMKIMGEQTDVTIEMLIAKLKNLIVDMIRLIRDQILNYFTEKLMELLKEISINVGVKLAVEQALYYYNLIMKLINCFKRNKDSLGFTVDEVNYADIYAQEPTPPTEC